MIINLYFFKITNSNYYSIVFFFFFLDVIAA